MGVYRPIPTHNVGYHVEAELHNRVPVIREGSGKRRKVQARIPGVKGEIS